MPLEGSNEMCGVYLLMFMKWLHTLFESRDKLKLFFVTDNIDMLSRGDFVLMQDRFLVSCSDIKLLCVLSAQLWVSGVSGPAAEERG